MEDCYLPDREFKVAVLKKLSELKENSGHSMSSRIKVMNRSTLSKRLKI